MPDPAETPAGPSDSELLATLDRHDLPELEVEGNVPEGGDEPSSLDSGALREALGEEFKPYSQFPWHRLPDEVRGDFLTHLKKFHGDMTRSSQEAAELRQEVNGLKQKADFFDRLSADPAFMQWYNGRTSPGSQPTQPVAGVNQAPAPLSEYLGSEGANALTQFLRQEIVRAVGPIANQVQYSQRQSVSERTERELEQLRAKVTERGWPDVDRHMKRMVDLVNEGRARTVDDAYWVAARDDILTAERDRALLESRQRLEEKSSMTVAPRVGPGGASHTVDEITGTEAALAAAMRELQGD